VQDYTAGEITMKRKLLWRHRKRSEADPIQTLECGCKVYVYDGTVVRHCEEHMPKKENPEGEI
jgi:hypothetical protein